MEVCLDQRWGTVNGDGWSSADTQVVCRQLGYLTASMSCLFCRESIFFFCLLGAVKRHMHIIYNLVVKFHYIECVCHIIPTYVVKGIAACNTHLQLTTVHVQNMAPQDWVGNSICRIQQYYFLDVESNS